MIGRHVRTRAGVFGAILRDAAHARRGARDRAARATSCSTTSASPSAPTTSPSTSPTATSAGSRSPARSPPSPKLLALDEPAAGMNATETAALQRAARRIRARRHDDPADRARHEAGDGPVRPRAGARLRQEDRRGHRRREVQKRPAVIAAYLGGDVALDRQGRMHGRRRSRCSRSTGSQVALRRHPGGQGHRPRGRARASSCA